MSTADFEPYTLAELHARIEASEASFEAGRFYTEEEANKKMQGYVNKRLKRNALDEAMEDLVAGRVYEVSSVDELRKRFEFV